MLAPGPRDPKTSTPEVEQRRLGRHAGSPAHRLMTYVPAQGTPAGFVLLQQTSALCTQQTIPAEIPTPLANLSPKNILLLQLRPCPKACC